MESTANYQKYLLEALPLFRNIYGEQHWLSETYMRNYQLSEISMENTNIQKYLWGA